MNERILQYIWQFQYYNTRELTTTDGEEISIINVGQLNSNQGPDFLHARVKIGNELLAGHVELHVCSSDWYRHEHEEDENYKNVVLHVVWQDNGPGQGPPVPTIVLEGRVSIFLLKRLLLWNDDRTYLPCANRLTAISELTLTGWKERLMIERLEQKARLVNDLLLRSRYHWEEVLWWMISRSFGLLINGEAMMEVAMSVPLSILKRHRKEIFQLEAILFGQAGLLQSEAGDEYTLRLNTEYQYWKDKYKLEKRHLKLHYLRMRPPSFPTIRLAQLAMFLHNEGDHLSSMVEVTDLRAIKKLVNVGTSEYWEEHYVFGTKAAKHPKHPGEQTCNSILINGLIPFMYRYGDHFARSDLVERSLAWMGQLPPEQNKITSGFRKLGLGNATALDSQAYIQLKSKYCDQRKCLECAIGNAVLSDPQN